MYGLLLLSRIQFLHQRRGCGGFIIVFIYGLLLLVLLLLLLSSCSSDGPAAAARAWAEARTSQQGGEALRLTCSSLRDTVQTESFLEAGITGFLQIGTGLY